MGSGPDRLAPDPAATARANAEAALTLLASLQRRGLRHLVLSPGSRSAPLAVAAALLERRGLRLHTAIDERSAAFFALGLGRGHGRPAAVVTTSGTAVAQLLAAAVEADLGTIPLLLLSADRPARLKNCGANQAVPQERFLVASCRRLLEGPPVGMAAAPPSLLEALAREAMAAALGDGRLHPAGPVHLNLPFDEPLHVAAADVAALEAGLAGLCGDAVADEVADEVGGAAGEHQVVQPPALGTALPRVPGAARLDPDQPGLVVAGPWRGSPLDWPDHIRALRLWQRRSGWPVLADALSGLRGLPDLELIAAYDPLLDSPHSPPQLSQVMRLGSLPASRRLQRWLQDCDARQVLVSQGDPRCLDPLGTVAAADQWSAGLASWVEAQLAAAPMPRQGDAAAAGTRALASRWRQREEAAQQLLARRLAIPLSSPPPPDGELSQAAPAAAAADAGAISEPWLARALSRLLPAGVPLMLASSSPVRDWESFADTAAPWRPIHGFRGASGIDGTLSIACGLAEALGQLVLVSGDLALLHDANGWLWSRRLGGRLTVVLIENGGGGIFEQLPIRTQPPGALDFERLFAMPQGVDQLALAAVHGVPGRRLQAAADLEADLAWALQQPFALLEVRTDRRQDALLRQGLRRMVAAGAGRWAVTMA